MGQGSFSAVNELNIGNRAFAELLHKMVDKGAEFEGGELEQVRAHVKRTANVWGAAEKSYNAGLLPKQTYAIFYDDMRNLLITYLGFRSAWRVILELYPNLQSCISGYSRELLDELDRED